jgi:hypothetical protein
MSGGEIGHCPETRIAAFLFSVEPRDSIMNVYRLFEHLGAQAAYDGEMDLENLDIDPELKRALEEKDQAAIERLLGRDTPLMMILVPADDDDGDDDGDDQAPADDDPEIRQAG